MSDDNPISEQADEQFKNKNACVYFWDSPIFMDESQFADFLQRIVFKKNDADVLNKYIHYKEKNLKSEILPCNETRFYNRVEDSEVYEKIRKVVEGDDTLCIDYEENRIVSLYLLISDENDPKCKIRKELTKKHLQMIKVQEDEEDDSAEKETYPSKTTDTITVEEEEVESEDKLPSRPGKPCYYLSQREMGIILKSRVDAIMKHYHGIDNLSDHFEDVEFVIYTARYRMLSKQTEERLKHPDAGVLPDYDAGKDRMFMYVFSDETQKKHQDLREKIDKHPSTLFVIVADECHWGITKGSEEKPSAHNLFINNFCQERQPENVIVVQISATPFNLLTNNSRIPLKPCSIVEKEPGDLAEGDKYVLSSPDEHEKKGSPRTSSSSLELHVVHWTEVEMKKFEKGVQFKLKCARMDDKGSVRYISVNKETRRLQICSHHYNACTFVAKGEHGVVTLSTLPDEDSPTAQRLVLRVENGNLELVQDETTKKGSEELKFQVKLEFGVGIAAFSSLAVKNAYICVDKENEVHLWTAHETRERGVTILKSQVDKSDTTSFEFFLEGCSLVEVTKPGPQYLSLNYYLSTLNSKNPEERKIRGDERFQNLVDKGRRQSKKKDEELTEGSLLCAEYVYYILRASALNANKSHKNKIELFREELMKQTEKEKRIPLKSLDFISEELREFDQDEAGETEKMIKSLIGQTRNGKGIMTIVRAKNMKQADAFFFTLRIARNVADLEDNFEIIRDYGGIRIQDQLMKSSSPFFKRLQPNNCCESECGCGNLHFVPNQMKCGNCKHVHKQITQYEDLEDLACVLILVDKGRMGDTFPHSFKCMDLRLSFDSSEESGNKSALFLSSLIQELGRMCRYAMVSPEDQSDVPYALAGRQLIKELKRSLQRSPAMSAIKKHPDRYMNMASKLSSAKETRVKHTRRWLKYVANKDSYDFENTSKHPNRLLLQAEPQIGKTGSYLYLIKLLRDDIVKRDTKEDFVFTDDVDCTENNLQSKEDIREGTINSLPFWKDMREAESLLSKPVHKGKYEIGGKFYTHEMESFPLELTEKPQRKRNPYVKEMTPSEVSSIVHGPDLLRAWQWNHYDSCSSCGHLLQCADPIEGEWHWPDYDGSGGDVCVLYSIPQQPPYSQIQKRLSKGLSGNTCNWGELYVAAQTPGGTAINYWIFHPSHRDPKKCTLNYQHIMVESGKKVHYIQAVVVQKGNYFAYKQYWGKTHMIIQLPDTLPGCSTTAQSGGVGSARLFIQKLAYCLKMEYVFVYDDNVALMSEAEFENGAVKRNEHGVMAMKRCTFSRPMLDMQSLVQGRERPVVDHTPYSLSDGDKEDSDEDKAKLKEMFDSFPQYSYTGPATVMETLSLTEAYAVVGLTKSVPKALKPFSKAQVYSAVLLNVKATVESGVFYRPWPCWEDLRFNDDCDKAGLWVLKFNRFKLWKIQYKDWINSLQLSDLFQWDETTILVHLPEENSITEDFEKKMILENLSARLADNGGVEKATLGVDCNANEEDTHFLKTVYQTLEVPEQSPVTETTKDAKKMQTACILQHAKDTSFHTYHTPLVATASNKVYKRLTFLRSAKDSKPLLSVSEVKRELCFCKEIKDRNPSVTVFSAADPEVCSLRCIIVDVTFPHSVPPEMSPQNTLASTSGNQIDDTSNDSCEDAIPRVTAPAIIEKRENCKDNGTACHSVQNSGDTITHRAMKGNKPNCPIAKRTQSDDGERLVQKKDKMRKVMDESYNKHAENGETTSGTSEHDHQKTTKSTDSTGGQERSKPKKRKQSNASGKNSTPITKKRKKDKGSVSDDSSPQEGLKSAESILPSTQKVLESTGNKIPAREEKPEVLHVQQGVMVAKVAPYLQDEQNSFTDGRSNDKPQDRSNSNIDGVTKRFIYDIPSTSRSSGQEIKNETSKPGQERGTSQIASPLNSPTLSPQFGDKLNENKLPYSSLDQTRMPSVSSLIVATATRNERKPKFSETTATEKDNQHFEGTNEMTREIVDLWRSCKSTQDTSDFSNEVIQNKLKPFKGTFEKRDKKGYNALLKACSLPSISPHLVSYLINEEKVDINCRLPSAPCKNPNVGIPAIALAVKHSNVRLVTVFKNRKSELRLLDSDEDGNTVLHHGVLKVSKTVFDKLFPLCKESQAWRNARNNEGKNILDIAHDLHFEEKKDSSSRKKILSAMIEAMDPQPKVKQE